jgi:metal transporter CNNM
VVCECFAILPHFAVDQYAIITILLFYIAALAAGMTVGLLSLDSLKLKIKIEVGTESERIAAQRILPIIANHHLLLCTLLLFNAMANEALPIFLDALVPSWAAILIAVTLVLICGEVLPSALFTGPSQLQIASRLIGLIYFLEIIFYPIAWPMAKMLDHALGHDDSDDNFNRDEISALVKIMRQKGATQIKEYLQDIQSGDNRTNTYLARRTTGALGAAVDDAISSHEANVITGVLGLSKIYAKDVCIPMSQVAMLSTDQHLDRETIDIIDKVGFSRLPVFKGTDMTHILGYLIVKRLINLNPADALPVTSVSLTEPLVVGAKHSLLDVMKIFQSGHRHIALVSEKPKELMHSIQQGSKPSYAAAPIGILTVEDVFERMIQAQIVDEEDRDKSMVHESASSSLREMSMRSSTASQHFCDIEDQNIAAAIDSKRRNSRSLSTTLFGLNFTGKDPVMSSTGIREPFLTPDNSDTLSDQPEEGPDSMAFSFLKSKGMTQSMVSSYLKNNPQSASKIAHSQYQ